MRQLRPARFLRRPKCTSIRTADGRVRRMSMANLRRILGERRRILLITGPSRRFIDQLPLEGLEVEIFDGARVHVPEEVVSRALHRFDEFRPDAVVTLGGGAATGLGKALRLERDFFFIAIPTTYSGSEMTSIYGIRADGQKRTGRDERVRPNAVVREPAFTRAMPLRLSIQSLLNALAHPIAAAASLRGDEGREALRAIRLLTDAALKIAGDRGGRQEAMDGAALAGRALEQAELGGHHRLAHFLGGRFDVDHAALHSVLLPHTLRMLERTAPEAYREIARAMGLDDPPAALFDLLRRSSAPTSLLELGIDEVVGADRPDAALIRAAFTGRRPSRLARWESWGFEDPVTVIGDIDGASRIVVALHGRGSNADAIALHARAITGDHPSVAIVAPQAPGAAWYPQRYFEAPDEHVQGALRIVDQTIDRLPFPPERVFLLGFSQGACLAAEAFSRRQAPLGGLMAFSGSRIGPEETWPPAPKLAGAPVLLGVSEADPSVAKKDVEATAAHLRAADAAVDTLFAPGEDHEIRALERIRARELLLGPRPVLRGFGNHFESEALPGALPPNQNSPQRVRYGLYAEQLNGTGFVARRRENLRSWLYRVRPSAQHGPLDPLEHRTATFDLEAAIDPNLAGWPPLPIPDEPADFVDGMVTWGGAGSPELRRGYAVHLYAANRSMESRAFYDADGDLLIIPQSGRLTLMTEMGVLEVEPGRIAVVPRGIRISVLLRDVGARGYVAEVFGRHFEVPERGPVGANGLTEARHFEAPSAYAEDRLCPGYRITAKLGGRLYEGRQDHSPHDVVAWHGNYTPYVYDLMCFSPVSSVRIDHPDPSIFTVMSAPLDETGANTLDLVFFPPRWDVTEGTFRPPFFHRNATTEINGIIRDPAGDRPPFLAGGLFVTPSMTPHGVRARAVERAFSSQGDEPHRFTESSMWFQLESTLPARLTPWAVQHEVKDWLSTWGSYRTHYDPNDQGGRTPG